MITIRGRRNSDDSYICLPSDRRRDTGANDFVHRLDEFFQAFHPCTDTLFVDIINSAVQIVVAPMCYLMAPLNEFANSILDARLTCLSRRVIGQFLKAIWQENLVNYVEFLCRVDRVIPRYQLTNSSVRAIHIN